MNPLYIIILGLTFPFYIVNKRKAFNMFKKHWYKPIKPNYLVVEKLMGKHDTSTIVINIFMRRKTDAVYKKILNWFYKITNKETRQIERIEFDREDIKSMLRVKDVKGKDDFCEAGVFITTKKICTYTESGVC